MQGLHLQNGGSCKACACTMWIHARLASAGLGFMQGLHLHTWERRGVEIRSTYTCEATVAPKHMVHTDKSVRHARARAAVHTSHTRAVVHTHTCMCGGTVACTCMFVYRLACTYITWGRGVGLHYQHSRTVVQQYSSGAEPLNANMHAQLRTL